MICSSIVGISPEVFSRSSDVAVREVSEIAIMAKDHRKTRITQWFVEDGFTILQSFQVSRFLSQTLVRPELGLFGAIVLSVTHSRPNQCNTVTILHAECPRHNSPFTSSWTNKSNAAAKQASREPWAKLTRRTLDRNFRRIFIVDSLTNRPRTGAAQKRLRACYRTRMRTFLLSDFARGYRCRTLYGPCRQRRHTKFVSASNSAS